jgi:glycosyltransferase involved in cell wall biosynthesis
MTPTGDRVRVLYCESNVDGTIGGSHFCLLYLLENLDRSRFEPIVIFYEEHALVSRFRDTAETLVLQRPAPFTLPPLRRGLATRRPLLAFPLVLLQRSVNFVAWLKQLRTEMTFLKSRGIRLINLNNSIIRHHDWMTAALLTRTPCVTHERGINRWYSGPSKFLGRRLNGVIAVSKAIREGMRAAGVDVSNVHVMYDGLDPTKLKRLREPAAIRESLGLAPGRPVVGIVGNVRRWKGQEVAVHAMARLVKAVPDLVLLIVGATAPVDEPYEQDVRSLVARHGLERNVIFCGYQKFPADYVAVMDVVVHASILPEPFGMVVLEAMAMRKPVVGARDGGVPEIIIEGVTGYTYPPGDAEALALRVEELLRDPALARRMGEAGYDRVVADFSVERNADQVEALYEDVLAGRTPSLRQPADDRAQPS